MNENVADHPLKISSSRRREDRSQGNGRRINTRPVKNERTEGGGEINRERALIRRAGCGPATFSIKPSRRRKGFVSCGHRPQLGTSAGKRGSPEHEGGWLLSLELISGSDNRVISAGGIASATGDRTKFSFPPTAGGEKSASGKPRGSRG